MRELEALEPMSYSLITERRRHAPQGRAGGSAASQGATPSTAKSVPAKASGELRAGQTLRIETPGGGGFGCRGEDSDA